MDRTNLLRLPALTMLTIVLGASSFRCGTGRTLLAQTGADRSQTQFEGTKAGAERELEGVKFCWSPPGRFRMGSPVGEPGHRPDEGPVDVRLSKGFWIGKYEVTQGEWSRIMGSFPREMDKGRGDDIPVYWINYPEAEEFCRRLTQRARASGKLPRNWEFRLPTEAQWEYACRAGTTTATSFGDRLSSRQANFNGKAYNGAEERPSLNRSVEVGSYPANPWGLHDMHGNVWEWCRDWYHSSLPGGTDPDLSDVKGAINRDGTYSRVRRSCAWIEDGWTCRSAMRLRYEPERRSDHIGLRIVGVRIRAKAVVRRLPFSDTIFLTT
jgi:formylglycine-generating enzyme